MIAFENKPQIGQGIYTLRDAATILHLPYAKVHRYVTKYWDGQLGEEFQSQYSWMIEGSRAVSFHTVVELYVMRKKPSGSPPFVSHRSFPFCCPASPEAGLNSYQIKNKPRTSTHFKF
jgi:hypothetical protein